MTPVDQTFTTLTVERDGHLLLIGLNRPEKRNSFNREMLADLARAYAVVENDEDIWCGVLFAHGRDFTTGLDLVDVGGAVLSGEALVPEGSRDPWRLDGPWTRPIVAAVHGWVMTLGIELLLAADIRVADTTARFTQLEVQRGIYPFGGATVRFAREAGWGNAMRWMLTGEEFDAAEALRIGLVQEVAADGDAVETALRIARTIVGKAAPLGVRATLASAHAALPDTTAAVEALQPTVAGLFTTADGAEGMTSFVERRAARFTGS